MRAIQVRNVPDETHAVLRRRAAAAGMSLQEYLLARLNEEAARPTKAEVLARVAEHTGGSLSLESATAAVQEERERR